VEDIIRALGVAALTVGLIAGGCGPRPSEGDAVARAPVVFPVHRNFGGGPAAIAGGILIVQNGCLAFDILGPEIQVPIWPEGTSAWSVDGAIVIADSGGRIVARVGDEAFFGGGYGYGLPGAQDLASDGIPVACQFGKFMLINDLERIPKG
jgi:hypothetical protein